MNYSAIKILPGDDDCFHKTRSKFIKTDAFTVLPPFSPQIPGPPPTPNPYRVLPPIVSRKKPSFVILQEVGSRPASREPSPSGRVSPFRGCGFKPSSREQSPARQLRKDESCDPVHPGRSRSRLPVAMQRKKNARRMSKSVSPVSHSNIPRPLNRHTSYSPNRLSQILLEMDSSQRKIGARPREATSREPQRSISQRNLKECATPRRSTQNLRVQKPPIPSSAPKATANNLDKTIPTCHKAKSERTSYCERAAIAKSAVMKPARQIPVSPVRAAKYEPALKNKRNLLETERRLPKSPTRSKSTSRVNSPSRSVSKKSKENVSPCSRTTSPVKTKNATTILKSSAGTVKTPLRTVAKTAKKLSCAKVCDVSDKGTAAPTTDAVVSSSAARTNEPAALIVTQASEEQTVDHKDDKSTTVRTIGRKALTTSNLLSAIKKTIAQDKGEEKRELSHTDTSRSLPISIGGTGMTDSAVTLIRTTTEPALAPVQPALIHEIRSAINEVRGGEEVPLTKSDAQNSAVTNPMLPSAVETSRDISSSVEEIKKKPITPSPSPPPPSPPPPQHSTHLKHVTAILEMKKPRANSDRDEKSLIKAEEDQPAGVNNPPTTATTAATTTTTTTTTSSSSTTTTTTNMKKESGPLNIKNQSTEYLVQPYENTAMDLDNRFRSQPSKRGRTIGGHPVGVSTISGTSATTEASEYPHESCYEKYLCYFCYKCKLRKRIGTMNAANSKSRKCSSCMRHKNGFRNVFNTLRCSKKKNRITLVDAKTNSTSPPPRECGSCCTFCGGSAYKKCFSMLCCWNSAVCLRMRNAGDKLRSGCWNGLCCGVKKQTVISESERRRSTISNARKPRKWTRIFTDFPKLDSSFVEHASVMRGAIPVLPLPIAWICLILNVFLPGSGTFSSGVFCLCTGKARFSINDSLASRFGSFLVNLLVAGSQLFTVLFCLVGWGWSIWWGVIMLRMAKKNKRIMLAEKVTHEPRPISVVTQNRDVERGTIT